MTDRHVANEPHTWAPVPEALLYDPAISDKAVRLYGALRRHGDDPANCYPSKRRLAELIGCAAASLGRPLRELEDAGWITRVTRPQREDGITPTTGYHVRLSRTSSATPAQESAPPPRTGARHPRAQERAKREPVNESQVTRSSAPTSGAQGDLQLETEPSPTDKLKTRARAVTNAVFEARAAAGLPKPPSWPNAYGRARAFLEAGVDDAQLITAMTHASATTNGAIEFELNRRRTSTPTQARNVDTDRAGAISDAEYWSTA